MDQTVEGVFLQRQMGPRYHVYIYVTNEEGQNSSEDIGTFEDLEDAIRCVKDIPCRHGVEFEGF